MIPRWTSPHPLSNPSLVYPPLTPFSTFRWFFGKMGCGFFPLAEEYLLITRTAMFLILALYPAFCNNMPDGGPCWIMRVSLHMTLSKLHNDPF